LPGQLQRLLIVVLVVVAVLVYARMRFVPETFGENGHYREAAIDSVAAAGIQYAGHEACIECHDDIGDLKAGSYHRRVNCEVCHGPGAAHAAGVEAGEDEPVFPRVPRGEGILHPVSRIRSGETDWFSPDRSCYP